MSDRTDNGISLFKVGQKEASQSYRLYADGTREKALNIQFYDALSIDARMLESPDFQAKSLCTPCAVNGWVYAQKTAALRVEGSLSCELGTFNLGELDCYGHHDFSSGFMRRETFWNWACFSAAPNDERPALGLNLSWGVNETGYSENCIWVGDQHQALPQVQFDYQRNALLDTWQIKSEDGSVNLRFEPEGKHSETLNAWVLASDFHQIFGRFYGEIRCANGEILKIESLWGFVEHQFSRW